VSRSPFKHGILIGSMPGSLGDGSLLRFLFLLSDFTSGVGAAGSELELHLVFFYSTWFLLIAFLRDGGFWFMHDLRIGELGVGSTFFSIITSLASRGVMVLPGFVVVVGSCDGLISIMRSMWAHRVNVWSAFSTWLGPVLLLVVWSCWGSLILL